MSEIKALSVTQLARRMRNLLEIEIGGVWVEGEVSNLRKQASGHWYFSIKDAGAQISCAMFGAKRCPGAEVIEDGAKVKIFGEVSFYEARGQAQMIVQKAQALGVGDLQAQFEALKKKLSDEGLFDQERKQKLPFYPKVIGMVTSPSGAALQDMLNVLGRRSPWLKVVLFPASVQGKGAEKGIATAIKRATQGGDGLPVPDVLIVGRGGGSLEDLWNFNEEVVARAIADCPVPVISAVGHEIDFTIADFVSDLRAPTPSAAAELCAPDIVELHALLNRQGERMKGSLQQRLSAHLETLSFYQRGSLGRGKDQVLRERMMMVDEARLCLENAVNTELQNLKINLTERRANWQRYHPEEVIKRRKDRLDYYTLKLDRGITEHFSHVENILKNQRHLLRTLGPEQVLERGYSITMREGGEVVKDPKQVKEGDEIEIMTSGGVIGGKVR